MGMIKDVAISLLTSGKFTGMQDEKDMDAMLRLIVLNITYLVASFFIIGQGVSEMRGGNVEHGLVLLIIGFMIFMNLLLLRTELPFMVGGCILTVLFGVFCGISFFAKDELRGFGSMWIYLYPLMSIFTLGLPAGFFPALILLFVTIAGTFAPGWGAFDYTVTEATLISGLYFFVMLLAVVYEYARSVKDHWLSRQDSYMNMVFKNSGDIILLLDKNDALIYCADVFLKRTHITFDTIRKKNYRDIFSRFIMPEKPGAAEIFLQTSIREKNPIVFERELDIGADGNFRYYEIHFTPMYNDEDIFQGTFVLFHDMTEIIEAKERTEQASRAKSTFLANMSHEMRTPLNAIIGMTTIAKDSNDVTRKDYCLGKIEGASAHLLGIIDDVLDMSKIESGKFELSCTDFDFFAMLQRVNNMFEFRFGEKKQQFSVNTGPRIPSHVISDEQRLSQVIANLISNAIKFTPEGGKISLDVQRIDSGDDPLSCELELRVTDSGIGISEEQQGILFQSFVQVDSGIARKFGGTGLGLVISKRIVEMMQGNIWIESDLGKGSTFIFRVKAQIPESIS
ncbi:MAG: PAS domain-containing protein, partial [Treponema sp.]|nr:PAS domain-containing protein [Treponema sp.]